MHSQVRWISRVSLVPGPVFEVPQRKYARDGKLHVAGAGETWMETEGGVAIVDSKTDRVSASEPPGCTRLHDPQLRLYARAIAKVTGRQVRSVALVFLAEGNDAEVGMGREFKGRK